MLDTMQTQIHETWALPSRSLQSKTAWKGIQTRYSKCRLGISVVSPDRERSYMATPMRTFHNERRIAIRRARVSQEMFQEDDSVWGKGRYAKKVYVYLIGWQKGWTGKKQIGLAGANIYEENSRRLKDSLSQKEVTIRLLANERQSECK